MACHNIVSGYPCGTLDGGDQPCDCHNWPYFRPNDSVTRGQFAKMIAQSAQYSEEAGSQIYEDVPVGSTFYLYINQISHLPHQLVQGYACGSMPNEPCLYPYYRPYFRPAEPATRAQIAKMVSVAKSYTDPVGNQLFEDVAPDNTFYIYIQRVAINGLVSGYPCGSTGEPCVPPGNRPYFRPGIAATRGQSAKMLSIAFFPSCGFLMAGGNGGSGNGKPGGTSVN